jgi:hypothetical protein
LPFCVVELLAVIVAVVDIPEINLLVADGNVDAVVGVSFCKIETAPCHTPLANCTWTSFPAEK